MRYIEVKQALKDFTVFSLADILRIDANFHRRRLNEWQDKGYIRKLVKGYYIFSDLSLNENSLFEIANRIYSPSYVSLETALWYYGFIPESVFGITSISTRRTYRFETGIAEFFYRTVSPHLFFGYQIIQYNDKSFKIASPEKAILDFFYLSPGIKNKEDIDSLRINKDVVMKKVNKKRLSLYLNKFRNKALKKRIKILQEAINHA